MKFNFLLLFGLLATTSFSQKNFDFGLFVKGNLSTQTTKDPTKPEDGVFQWDNLATFGAGFFASKELNRNMQLGTRLSYMQKGFVENADYGSIGSNSIIGSTTFQNTFKYISIDILAKIFLSKKNIRPFAFAGLQSSFLFSKKLESDIYPNNGFYPLSEYGNYKTNTNSWIVGLGLDLNKTMSLEVEVNKDFTPVINKDNLVVKNWLWSLTMQVSLYNILKNKPN